MLSRFIDGIMKSSAVDVTLYIRCMLWACAYVGWATYSCATTMTRFTFCIKKKKKKKGRHSLGFCDRYYELGAVFGWVKTLLARDSYDFIVINLLTHRFVINLHGLLLFYDEISDRLAI
jgi:hypothetical protein